MLNNKHTLIKSPTTFMDSEKASAYTAHQIAELIRQKQKEGKPAVLGLATGNTPKLVYKELIRLHKEENLSFENVISFNLDEYYPIEKEHHLSYTYFMAEQLFNHVDIKKENIHIPHTDFSQGDIEKYCLSYEDKINSFGGLDLQLLGIGRNGHIGFNEPGSSFDSITRLIDLHPLTREDAAPEFGTLNEVPHQAISIGINTIMNAKKILLLALGERKSEIVNKALNGEVTTEIPASVLQTISHVEYILDKQAAQLIALKN
ncbi:glucosamine-6-phosphate deaminase [Brumimicrobium oceani]|uniref:Glucosamine-6-phosphate deaminase n=1 Tax=Brumimicrobium oceani TaxID=2100725 RepID=A0A2U2XEH4_9FLAO|nr:glucosamine-6-phosphate deaminase [Brumimicrobium oceani]PWH86194.1 glucosamine-6-phosphate deaminase [Brumimicrobium oceani]